MGSPNHIQTQEKRKNKTKTKTFKKFKSPTTAPMRNKEKLIKSCKRVKCRYWISVLLEIDQHISLLFRQTMDRLMKINET